jgi:ribosomal protein L40E
LVKCPYCAEDIQEGAAKCRHCGEWLRPAAANLTATAGVGAKLQRLHWLLRGFLTFWVLNWAFGVYFLYLTLNRQIAPFMYLSFLGAAAWMFFARPPIGSVALGVGTWALVWWSFTVERNRYGHDYYLGDVTALHFLVFTVAAIPLVIAWVVKLTGLKAKAVAAQGASPVQAQPPTAPASQEPPRYKVCPRCGTSAALTDIYCSACGRQYRTKFE